MGFASGFVTGLAKSVDDQLKSDIMRTQKRMDGMEQYRVTRRRADEERMIKEREEVSDVMNNLASLVGGDIYKASQLYEAGGGTTSGATEFYQTLKASQASLGKSFDINKAVDFSKENRPDGVTDKQYIDNYVRGVKRLGGNQGFEASGLLGKMFGGSDNYSKQIDKRVDKSAPIAEDRFGLIKTAPAKINHAEFLAAKKYEKDNQAEAGSTLINDMLLLETELRYEKDPIVQKDLEKRIKKRRSDILQAAINAKKSTNSKSAFSLASRDSLVKNAYELALGDKFLKPGIGDAMIISLEGNEIEGWGKKIQAMNNLKSNYETLNDTVFNTQIENEKRGVQAEIKGYKNSVAAGSIEDKKYYGNYTSMDDVLRDVKTTSTGTGANATTKEPIIKKGDVITVTEGGVTKTIIWTGAGFI